MTLVITCENPRSLNLSSRKGMTVDIRLKDNQHGENGLKIKDVLG
jgi:hypothetical protein